MTSPNNRHVAGAIDLGEIKARAEAREQAELSRQQGGPAGGVEIYFTAPPENLENEVIRRSLQVPGVVQVDTPRSPDS